MNKAIEEFNERNQLFILKMAANEKLIRLTNKWLDEANKNEYSYHFTWLGRPIIQYPQDMVAMQEIIWNVQPDLIIETGIAHGGSLIFYASILELIGKGSVLGIDIDIRKHNRAAIEAHPMFKRIAMIEGSSISEEVLRQVRQVVKDKETVLVVLDSNHTHDHVLSELQAYASLVSVGSYCCVFDTLIEDLPGDMFPDRPWGKGNNPKTAVLEYLKSHKEFEIDKTIQNKLLITVAPDGYLKRVR
jgi:cephalosporin hydroxylase